MFSKKLNYKILSGSQNTSTLRLASRKLYFHITVKEQMVLEKTSELLMSLLQVTAPTGSLPWMIGPEGGTAEDSTTRDILVCSKDPVCPCPEKSLPHSSPRP